MTSCRSRRRRTCSSSSAPSPSYCATRSGSRTDATTLLRGMTTRQSSHRAGKPQRILLVSPVRNERPHIERVVRAVAEQRRPPDRWVVVDDGSDDGTLEVLRALAADVPFMTVTSTPPRYTKPSADRLASAAAPRAFNFGLRDVRKSEFTHIGKLDGDIELPSDYFERLLSKFGDSPRLGIAGGVLVERFRGGWRQLQIPRHHVQGALKLYSLE